ncbi:hypothetical protein SETIT_1G176200v2 [Setaria italica]|uniref:Uncharacterized protein n=1 Tax=Setaria italica TaxID=4555 RepID=A0A368PMF3_SETIT|nr:hypothetical protein SETIT_1G176200v2 [Setaria italica]
MRLHPPSFYRHCCRKTPRRAWAYRSQFHRAMSSRQLRPRPLLSRQRRTSPGPLLSRRLSFSLSPAREGAGARALPPPPQPSARLRSVYRREEEDVDEWGPLVSEEGRELSGVDCE